MIKSGATQQRQCWRRTIKAWFDAHPDMYTADRYHLLLRHKLGIHRGKIRYAQYKKLARWRMAIIEGGHYTLVDDGKGEIRCE